MGIVCPGGHQFAPSCLADEFLHGRLARSAIVGRLNEHLPRPLSTPEATGHVTLTPLRPLLRQDAIDGYEGRHICIHLDIYYIAL